MRNKRCKRLKEDQKTSQLAKFKQEGLSKTFQAYQGKLGVVLDPNFRLIRGNASVRASLKNAIDYCEKLNYAAYSDLENEKYRNFSSPGEGMTYYTVNIKDNT
ncbi:MAG: hypothetical protein ACTTJC_00665 [Campylobacter sp.]